MYDKPDDIPQWAWDMAVEAADAASGPMGAIWGHEQGAPAIAKFIIQARSEAFEECAKIADAHGNNWTGSRDIETAINDSAKDDMAEAISQAIRQHSQKGIDK